MKQIALPYESWYMNRDDDWDCTFHLMVVGGEEKSVDLLPWSGSPADTNRFREKYPEVELLDINISMHRGKMEKCSRLEIEWPEHWKLIGETWAEWENA